MTNIGLTIKRIRQQKGYSQEFMATQLNITQASYARMENQQINLSAARLQKIAEVLETDAANLFGASKLTIQNQENQEGAYGNEYVGNLYIENQESLKKIIQTMEGEIERMKDEILFLRGIVGTLLY